MKKEATHVGKEEKLLVDLLEKVSALEDKLTNIEFLFVQSMGAGGAPIQAIPSGTAKTTAPGPVEVDLAPLEKKITEIEQTVSGINNNFAPINKLIATLNSEKSRKADELITQATTLLEQGLQLTELETTMLELKDRLDEISIQLEVANTGMLNEEETPPSLLSFSITVTS